MTSRRALIAGGAALLAAHLAGCTESAAKPGGASIDTASASPSSASAGSGATTSASEPLRFVVGSDGHFGEAKAPGNVYPKFVEAVNRLHEADPLDFVVVNGDIAQGGIEPQHTVRKTLDELAVPYYVVPGNHDGLSPEQWQDVWGSQQEQVIDFGDRSIVLANTSNAVGDYLCADVAWLAEALASAEDQRDVLVFMHITCKDWTTYGVDCPDVRKLLSRVSNLRAVFNGHDHDEDGRKTSAGVDYFFDGHLGGHWGTDYTGFRVGTLDGNQLATRMVQLDGVLRPEIRISW